ncbi:uncharacterized protein LAESUDRAFT_761618 [Laetiporus sulphureus 93-53]|uniref:F-box domain-containing protein n=1 Tax=Laetiporus sulphureus 93-53 TaxID=1314785 RepID=A0A165CYR4_9APHY|nr:uncharacterized protein LAESUDRAFT_761618 [Laetiporus sulphureus 93-53]KZT03765.1 hypothetical protein LAESUDRAFT_761618 [Laetiporus sulphureus 93-53]
MTGILDLPYDLLYKLCDYLSAVDIASLLSANKFLHKHSRDESIWRRLSARCGLRDTTYFSDPSFYTAYTQLLHRYGPLIGLWASDLPFMGCIVEFRIFPGDEREEGGIIGEMWEFPKRPSDDDMPSPPVYMRVFKISMKCYNEADSSDVQACLCIQCTHGHDADLRMYPPTYQNYFLHDDGEVYAHPDFPSSGADWYDAERGLPLLPESAVSCTDQYQGIRMLSLPAQIVLFTSPTESRKPGSITMECTTSDWLCMQRPPRHPPVPFDIYTPTVPRYFPLKYLVQKGVHPNDDSWSMGTLSGLWLGYYSEHTTQCLFLSWHEELKELHACKITGGRCVPRGARTWTVQSALPDDPVRAETLGMDPRIHRIFPGTGVVGDLGFPVPIDVNILVGILGPDEIQIWWEWVDDGLAIRKYTRYTGRHNFESSLHSS